MKKLFFAALFITALAYVPAKAQLRISLNLNLGSQPDWGPTGYDHAEFYYMPDIDTYYDVPNHQYVYLNGRTWTRSASLPPRYANYDVYHGYKAVINEPTPWAHAATYRTKFAQYKGRKNQTIIRDSRETKYRNSRTEYNKRWGQHDNGNHNGQRDDHRDNGHGNDRHEDHGHH